MIKATRVNIDVLDSALEQFIGRALEPFFAFVSTPAVHEPLDSRAHHRERVYHVRGSQLTA